MHLEHFGLSPYQGSTSVMTSIYFYPLIIQWIDSLFFFQLSLFLPTCYQSWGLPLLVLLLQPSTSYTELTATTTFQPPPSHPSLTTIFPLITPLPTLLAVYLHQLVDNEVSFYYLLTPLKGIFYRIMVIIWFVL